MMKKFLLASVVLLVAVGQSNAAIVWTNPITGTNPSSSNPYTTGQTVIAGVGVSGIERGSGIAANTTNDRYNANGWNSVSFDANDYFLFTITPSPLFELDLTSFVYSSQASGTGPTSFAIRSSNDSFASNLFSPTSTGGTFSLAAAPFQNLTTAITFRLYGWGASAGTGTFSVNDFTFNGEVTAVPEPTSLLFGGILGGAGWIAFRRQRKAKQAKSTEPTIA